MFYPVDSLKRGGRFYLCWVADSWPLRFATITHRQLWSQDVRNICDDLMEVIKNESGRPTKRFSLRLSSQLLRGLARLYQRKVTVFLADLCMINANVIKHANRKYNVHESEPVEHVRRPRIQTLAVQEIFPEHPEAVPRVEDLLQTSGNVVSNIQDITLKETVIPEIILPNDGFGEEKPDHALELLQDRTLEMMMVQPEVSAVHSGLDLQLDTTDKSYDKSRDRSRLALEPPQMETISELDITMFRKSADGGEQLIPEFEKDIPEIPEIPLPELPVPEPEKVQEQPVPQVPKSPNVPEQPKQPEPVETELEELEELEPQIKKRRIRKLIIDKKTKLDREYFKTRIENPMVETRCEDSTDDIVVIRVPVETYFKRPCHSGNKFRSNLGLEITRMFLRNLGVMPGTHLADREIEVAVFQKSNRTARSKLGKIDEEPEVPVQEIPQIVVEQPTVPVEELDKTVEQPRVEVEAMDIAEMLTQKVETLSQARKRTAEAVTTDSPKKRRSVGYLSFRESQRLSDKAEFALDTDANKENIPANIQAIVPEIIEEMVPENIQLAQDAEQLLSSMLQQAGLADIQQPTAHIIQESQPTQRQAKSARRTGSDSSETPLGSLDRTKVSLGDSQHTTDSKRAIRDQWGTEGTMLKILQFIKSGIWPINVTSLITKSHVTPAITGYQRIIAATCFTSILKLKQHGFLYICKDPDTLEITNITLGSRFTNE